MFIADYWWVWLIGVIVTYSFGAWHQMARFQPDANPFQGMAALLVAAFLNAAFSVLLSASIVLNVIGVNRCTTIF